MGAWPIAGRPRRLPFELGLEDLGLSLDTLRASLDSEQTFGKPYDEAYNEVHPAGCRFGFVNPPLGRLIGKKLTCRIGALVSRPGCVFASSFLWQYDRGSDMSRHLDRAPLDITMTMPIVLDGVDTWPMRVRQPEGDVFEWPSRPGTVLVFDGRWRPHWREAFQGRRSIVLLLHWHAPAVLWPELLDGDQCRRLCADAPRQQIDWTALRERSTALARSAVPQTEAPDLEVVDLPGPSIPDANRGVVLLAPLQSELALTFGRVEVTVAPGDAVAFAVHEECRLDWPNDDGVHPVLLGRGHPGR